MCALDTVAVLPRITHSMHLNKTLVVVQSGNVVGEWAPWEADEYRGPLVEACRACS